jgi:hypothetical protein
MPTIYRSMYAADDGLPSVHQSASGLCVRRGYDIFPDDNDNVRPEGLGMTVRPSVDDIPDDFKRKRWVVWEIDTEQLPEALQYLQDRDDHGVLEPAWEMSFEDYEDAILETRSEWRRNA